MRGRLMEVANPQIHQLRSKAASRGRLMEVALPQIHQLGAAKAGTGDGSSCQLFTEKLTERTVPGVIKK